MSPLLLPLDDAGEALSVSRQTVYRLIARGELEAVKFGKARRITAASLEAFIERLRAESGSGAA